MEKSAPSVRSPGPRQNPSQPTRSSSSRSPATESSLPDKDLARTLAMETAAKIDAIESEMARDFLRPAGGQGFNDSAANSTIARPSQQPVLPPTGPATLARPTASMQDMAADADDPLEFATDQMHGNANAMELQAEGGGSAIEEAAILFANGMTEPAEANLRAAVHSDALGESAQTAWLMLFELLNQRGDKIGFDNLAVEYALRFESSPAAWVDYREQPAPAPAAAVAVADIPVGTVRLPEAIDGNIVKPLEQLKNLSQQHQSLTIDASSAKSIDPIGAELLLRVINAFKRASHELTLMGAEQLIVPLRAAIEPGRRDPTDATWMLLLEVYRLLNQQHDFEETGIQYCITYEVSPPSWEPPPPNLKARPASLVATPEVKAAPVAEQGLAWRGTITGEGEPHFGRLLVAARTEKRLVVDCTQLRRVDFAAATTVVQLVSKIRQGSATVELRNVNYLVGSLFNLLGVNTVASVQLRRT